MSNLDYYLEDGFVVFTKEFHLKRGYCCKNGCKNCPYKNDEMVEDVSGDGIEPTTET